MSSEYRVDKNGGRDCFEMAGLIKFTTFASIHSSNDLIENARSGNLTTLWLRIKGVLSIILKPFKPGHGEVKFHFSCFGTRTKVTGPCSES